MIQRLISKFRFRRPAQPSSRPSLSRPLSFQLIDKPDQLPPLYKALDQCEEVAIDTEADNMYHYDTRACLLQINISGEIFLLDLLPSLPLETFWQRLSEKHLVMHGSDFDIRLLWELCHFRPKSLFDTMLAAQLLNYRHVGLAGLIERHFGVHLNKSGQKANWSKRPILPKLLNYAATDVWYLFELRDILARELKRQNRLKWLDQQCERQIESGLNGLHKEENLAWRTGPAANLRGHGLGVLYTVWHWRDRWAQKLDVPHFKVCGNTLVSKIAFAAESGSDAETIARTIHLGKRHERLIESLTGAIREGIALDPATLPRRPRQERHPLSSEEIERQDRIKSARDQVAAKLKMEPTLIATRLQLVQLARDPSKIDDILMPWQAEILKPLPALQLHKH